MSIFWPLVKHRSTEPRLPRFFGGELTSETEKGSTVLGERRPHLSAAGSVNPGICGSARIRALIHISTCLHSPRSPQPRRPLQPLGGGSQIESSCRLNHFFLAFTDRFNIALWGNGGSELGEEASAENVEGYSPEGCRGKTLSGEPESLLLTELSLGPRIKHPDPNHSRAVVYNNGLQSNCRHNLWRR